MSDYDLPRRLAAEALGTGILVCTIVGSGIMADKLTDDTALQLVAGTLSICAILVVVITMFLPISGAHINPAITLGFLVNRSFPLREAVPYIAAQVSGGAMGAFMAHLMFDLPVIQTAVTERSEPSQWLSEFVAAFGLMAVILTANRFQPKSMAWMVGLYIAAAFWFASSTSFVNPAVTLARSLTDTAAGIRFMDVPAFVASQVAGVICAVFVMTWLLHSKGQAGGGPSQQPDNDRTAEPHQ